MADVLRLLDRSKAKTSIVNAAVRVEDPGGHLGEARYFFSMSGPVLAERPFRTGWVYVVPNDTFDEEPPREVAGRRVHLHHWASARAVRPLFAVEVRPSDFPFLKAIRPHDEATLAARAARDPNAFPWVDEP